MQTKKAGGEAYTTCLGTVASDALEEAVALARKFGSGRIAGVSIPYLLTESSVCPGLWCATPPIKSLTSTLLAAYKGFDENDKGIIDCEVTNA